MVQMLNMGLAACLLAGLVLSPSLAQDLPGPPTLENLLGPDLGQPPADLPLRSPGRTPQSVPDQGAVEEARGLIKLAFEEDYRAAAATPILLLQKLVTAAGQTTQPVRRYALYLEAEHIAAAHGDISQTFELVDMRAQDFAIDGIQVRLERLKAFLTTEVRKDPNRLSTLYDQAMKTAVDAMAQEAYAQAKASAELADAAARSLSSLGNHLKKDALAEHGRVKQVAAKGVIATIEDRIARCTDYRRALDVLEATPDDPAANGIVGSYLCFERGDWAKGLAALAKSDRKEATAAALREIEVFSARNPDATEVFEVAEKWWSAAERADGSGVDAAAMKRRAADLYGSVRERLSDPVDRQIAAKRASPAGENNPSSPLAPAPRVRDLPADAFKIGDHWYFIFPDAMTQADALAACAARGGYLAQLTEKQELIRLAAKLEQLGAEQSYWIDGTDAGHEGRWTFLDGTPMPETQAWFPGQPDNRSRREHGLVVWVSRRNGRWIAGFNDAPQSDRYRFICEWD